MADKQINTRISLKYDTLENWKNNTVEGQGGRLVLLAGEIGIATITQPNITDKELPPVMFKVGDGKTEFRNLNWTSALAADVYGWAKEAGIKIAYVDGTGNVETTPSGVYVTDMAWDSTNSRINVTTGNIVINKVGSGNFVKNVAWNDTNKGIDITLTDIEPEDLPAFDYVQSVTSEDVATTRENGTITLTVDTSEGSGGVIYPKVKGFDELMPKTGGTFTGDVTFNTALYVGSSKYPAPSRSNPFSIVYDSDAAQGDPTVIISGSGPLKFDFHEDIDFSASSVTVGKTPIAPTDVANKQYVDSEIAKIEQFNYIVSTDANTTPNGVIWYSGTTESTKITGTLTASAATEYTIYLVPCKHTAEEEQKGYDEYLTVKVGDNYTWEVIGNTQEIDLSGYVNSLEGAANNGVVTNITKSDNKLIVSSTDLTTASPTSSSGNAYEFIDSVSQAANGKITATKKTVPTVTTGANGLMSYTDKVKLDGIEAGAQKNVNSFGTVYAADQNTIVASKPGDEFGFDAGDLINVGYVAESEVFGAPAISFNHAVPSGAAVKTSGLYKIATDAYGHVTGTTAVTKTDITDLGVVSANNAALKDRDGNAIFTANASEDVTIMVINCGSSTEVI